MGDKAASNSGLERLRTSGIGVILAGVGLVASVSFVSYTVGALVIAGLGLGIVSRGERTWMRQIGVGLLGVGGIALVEALSGFGLGLEPAVLGGLAIIFGSFDIVASVTLEFVSDRFRS